MEMEIGEPFRVVMGFTFGETVGETVGKDVGLTVWEPARPSMMTSWASQYENQLGTSWGSQSERPSAMTLN